MQTDVAVSSALDGLRWVGAIRLVGAALVAAGVVLELLGELLGHTSERVVRSAREAEIASLAAQVEALRRVVPRPRQHCGAAPESEPPKTPGIPSETRACPIRRP